MRAQPVKVDGRWMMKSWHTGPNGGDCVAIAEELDTVADTKNGQSIQVSPDQVRALIRFATNW